MSDQKEERFVPIAALKEERAEKKQLREELRQYREWQAQLARRLQDLPVTEHEVLAFNPAAPSHATPEAEGPYRMRWNGEGEPYFVIRGKDKFAVAALAAWLDAARKHDKAETELTGFASEPLTNIIKSASNVLQSIFSWQANFGVKVPDLAEKVSPLSFARNRHRTSDFGKEHLQHVNPDGTDKVASPPAAQEQKPVSAHLLREKLLKLINDWCPTKAPVDRVYFADAAVKVLLPLFASPIPASGWVLVPREPTEDMLATARFRVAAISDKNSFEMMAREAYAAMLAAAPVAPVAPGETK